MIPWRAEVSVYSNGRRLAGGRRDGWVNTSDWTQAEGDAASVISEIVRDEPEVKGRRNLVVVVRSLELGA